MIFIVELVFSDPNLKSLTYNQTKGIPEHEGYNKLVLSSLPPWGLPKENQQEAMEYTSLFC